MTILSKLISGLFSKLSNRDEDYGKRVAENHPEIKQMQKQLEKRSEEYGRQAGQLNDKLKEKYKGTPLEKYFKFDD